MYTIWKVYKIYKTYKGYKMYKTYEMCKVYKMFKNLLIHNQATPLNSYNFDLSRFKRISKQKSYTTPYY
jgi:hypothetical protein